MFIEFECLEDEFRSEKIPQSSLQTRFSKQRLRRFKIVLRLDVDRRRTITKISIRTFRCDDL